MPSRRVKRRRAKRKIAAAVAQVLELYRNLDSDDAMRRMLLQALPQQRFEIRVSGRAVMGRIWPEL